jgi:carbamoyltransferase
MTPRKQAWFHVDMDGLDAIYRGHGRVWGSDRDNFYLSAVENSLQFFEAEKLTATYFVIAKDLEDRDKRQAVESVVRAGHHIACHGYSHRYLDRVDEAHKREEIVTARKVIEDTLGVSCLGFRAPGYSIDFPSLEILRDSGYLYDSSIFPNYTFRKRLGVQRLFPEPFLMFPEARFFEVPQPWVGPLLPPFHPCYAFYLGHRYFRRCLEAFSRRHGYLTCLLHLTDFATPQRLRQGLRLDLFTNNLFGRDSKLAFLRKIVADVRARFEVTTTEAFLRDWPASAPDLAPRVVLGVSTTHETGACLVKDGEIVAAINEERLSRRKLDNAYPPVQSIREVIRLAGIEPAEIDAVAIAGLHWKDLLSQTTESLWTDVKDFHAWNDYIPHFARILYRLFYFTRALGYGSVTEFLRREYGIAPKVYHVEHHEAHAASAHRTAARGADTLVVTADGVGDDVSLTFSQGRGSTIRRLATFFYPNSFGQFYTGCTQILGFKAGRHEGKITGLAGYGRPDPELIGAVERTFFADDGGFRLHKRYYSEGFMRPRRSTWRDLLRGRFDLHSLEYRNYKRPLKRLVAGHPRENVAYTFQHLLEREMVRLARRHRPSGPLHLALAGGVFANVRLNMAISREIGADSVYVFPNMGDGGLCLGAALSVTGAPPTPAPTMYLGTGYTPEEILEVLGRHPELTFTRPDDLASTVAQALADGKIVARFDGRMEFGPRALGNRSILYHCGDRTVNDWLNRQLRRTEFMPFAPIAIWEDAQEYFDVAPGERRACEFMTLVVRCTERMERTCPAAVHVDGTARPQLLRRDVNPGMYDILTAYKRLTGISCLINTSFNMHEEPIVRSPEEAISAFLQSHLDFLVLGPFLVRQATQGEQPVQSSVGDAEPCG